MFNPIKRVIAKVNQFRDAWDIMRLQQQGYTPRPANAVVALPNKGSFVFRQFWQGCLMTVQVMEGGKSLACQKMGGGHDFWLTIPSGKSFYYGELPSGVFTLHRVSQTKERPSIIDRGGANGSDEGPDVGYYCASNMTNTNPSLKGEFDVAMGVFKNLVFSQSTLLNEEITRGPSRTIPFRQWCRVTYHNKL